ncbi:MAG: glycoside hydrolase family 1 protein [Lachnospiraceae bacterium]|nr:glycoside hydrolase family 1 protein [Lachnospiraceae bacterium]
MSFPKGFMFGAATAAHQVEGNNTNSDCWAQEQMEFTSFNEPSGESVDHYHRYKEDIKLLADAGLNAYRFSIEWARIEPTPGVFDENEVAHYRDVIRTCKENGIEPIVTLHHFSSPKWLIEQGGWEAEETVAKFANYAKYITEQLGDEIHYICTINEANMGIQIAAISKRMMMAMQKKQSLEGQVQVGINLENPLMERMKKAAEENVKVFGTPQPQVFVSPRTENGDQIVMRAHQAARRAIKSVKPEIQVGLTLSLHDIQAQEGGEAEALREWTEEFLHYLPYLKDDDFFGVQNYTRTLMGPEGSLPVPDGAEVTQMDYEFYPQALGHVIRKVHKELPIPIIVTENGVAATDDTRRVAFIKEALAGVESCIADGIPVLGYCYWSLLDNFEWQKGYSMTFGLIAVDRSTQKRYPKESLTFLGSYAK